MKPTHIKLVALAMFAFGAGEPALAAPNAVLGQNYSSATQDGSLNTATIEQTAAASAAGNSSTIQQIGDDNHVYGVNIAAPFGISYDAANHPVFNAAKTGVIQDGTGGTLNKSEIYQKATPSGGAVSGDKAAVEQGGVHNNNVSRIYQYSNGNMAVVLQGQNGGTDKFNDATILQKGSALGTGNVAGIIQDGIGDSSLTTLNTATISQDGNSNWAKTVQGGSLSSNASVIVQSGSTQSATVSQSGSNYMNTSKVDQHGGGSNTATVTQYGDNNILNDATIDQKGAASSGNTATILQYGTLNTNTAEITQENGAIGSHASVTQYGLTNTSEAYITQESGSGNTADISQSGTSNTHSAEIHQSGSSDTAIVSQSGTLLTNSAVINQTGNNNYASVTQH